MNDFGHLSRDHPLRKSKEQSPFLFGWLGRSGALMWNGQIWCRMSNVNNGQKGHWTDTGFHHSMSEFERFDVKDWDCWYSWSTRTRWWSASPLTSPRRASRATTGRRWNLPSAFLRIQDSMLEIRRGRLRTHVDGAHGTHWRIGQRQQQWQDCHRG